MSNPNGEATWEDLQPVDTLGLEVGYRLIQLVDKDRNPHWSHESVADVPARQVEGMFDPS